MHRISLLLFQLMIVRLVTEGDALLPQPRQPLAVDVDATDRWHSRGVVPENIAHVVEQSGGHQHDRRRTLFSTVNSIHEHSCICHTAENN